MVVSYTSHSVIVTHLFIGIAVLFEDLTYNLKYFLIECSYHQLHQMDYPNS